MSLEDRIDELESRLAFQDDSIQALNDVIVKQQQLIDVLERKMAALINLQQQMQTQLVELEGDAPPPHY